MNPDDPDPTLLNEAINILSDGGIIIYPTDTLYGLGANIYNKKAIRNIYNIKGRDKNKPMSVCVSSIEVISLIANIPSEYKNLIMNNLPGPFTFILSKNSSIPYYFMTNNGKIGIRVPKSEIARKLSHIFPITATSANLSGKEALRTPKEIANQLNVDVDLVIDVGPLGSNSPSTVVDLTTKEIKILRQGSGHLSHV
ncbi:threonylcarbamoyl-AMP synthase [Methanobrevibacter cuticularis]|uniref:L-threonylcarbamoyladenylate synthase n=2 Tax=Methanobrevibacter cuticularis TaxID=47311 RepID=A0A166DD17_9EURY|nr:threonylcarbamoyl-AMP synthase [Methanobrevibacter cuticularis]